MRKPLLWISGVLPAVLAGSIAAPTAVRAQESPDDPVGASLCTWERRIRLAIVDRGGAYDGRLSSRGILQRFNPAEDHEYELDEVSFAPTLGEEYAWCRSERGARFWTGSINHRRLTQNAEVRARVALGNAWSFGANYTQSETLREQRSLVEAVASRRIGSSGMRVFGSATLESEKPESDVEIGIQWRSGVLTVAASVTALDLFSDFIYEGLGVRGVADTVLDYERHPFLARIAAEGHTGSVRAEVFAAVVTPTRLTAADAETPSDGFAQDERFGYAAGLVAWEPSPRTSLGATASVVRGRTRREAFPTAADPTGYDLVESTRTIGAYAIHRVARSWLVESRVQRVWRGEQRDALTSSVTAVDYQDVAWSGRIDVGRRSRSGFRMDVGLDFVLRSIPSSSGPPPVNIGHLDNDNVRLRFDVGWEFGATAYLMVGANADLDGDFGTALRAFDGGHGRFGIYW